MTHDARRQSLEAADADRLAAAVERGVTRALLRVGGLVLLAWLTFFVAVPLVAMGLGSGPVALVVGVATIAALALAWTLALRGLRERR